MSKLATSRSAQTIRVLIVMFEDIIPNVVLSNGVVCLLWLSMDGVHQRCVCHRRPFEKLNFICQKVTFSPILCMFAFC